MNQSAASPVKSVVWIASYPKSGNTWVRFLIYNALFGAPDSSISVSQKIPDIHRRMPFDMPDDGRLFAKTHFAFSQRHPHAALTGRAVHVVRHPADVLLSALNYHKMNGVVPAQGADERYARAFIQQKGDPGYIQHGFGTWEQHATSWGSRDGFPVHSTTYEKLKADTAGELRTMLEFLHIDATDDSVRAAVDGASFDSMRSLEEREKASGTNQRLFPGSTEAGQQGRFFMNKGETGQSLDERIAPGLDAALRDAFGPSMERWGYA